MKRVVRLGLGWTFVVLGVAGLVLPILQGILFLAIGLGILAPESRWAQARLGALRKRFPQSAQTFDRAAQRVSWIVDGAGRRKRT